jgi:hypothetical protein
MYSNIVRDCNAENPLNSARALAFSPKDSFEGAAAVEAGGAGVGVFGFGGGFVEFYPLFAEKLKVLAHRSRNDHR